MLLLNWKLQTIPGLSAFLIQQIPGRKTSNGSEAPDGEWFGQVVNEVAYIIGYAGNDWKRAGNNLLQMPRITEPVPKAITDICPLMK